MRYLLAPVSPFNPPTLLYVILTQPVKLLVRILDFAFSFLCTSPRPDSRPIRVVCISDTHCLKAANVPDGDLLIHAGDLANAGTPAEIQAQVDWLTSLPHEHKVAIAGNHDTWLDPRSRGTLNAKDQADAVDWKGIWYLQHSGVTLGFSSRGRELKLFGAPQIPACGGEEFAFQYPRGTDAWTDTIPRDVDVLVTHTPPKYHLDLPAALGCEHLLREVWQVRPQLHIFGHVHAGKADAMGWLKAGREVAHWDEKQKTVERALRRPDGLLTGLIDPRGWLDVALVLYYGISGLVWDRVWGGAGQRGTIMVNASLMYNDTGQLRHPAQIVDI